MPFILLLLCFLSLSSCQSNIKRDAAPLVHLEAIPARFLSINEAKKQIVRDDKDFFFNQITNIDISIQMHKDLSSISREEALSLYKNYIQEDIDSFSAVDKALLGPLYERAWKACLNINPNFSLPEVLLIKTKGSYYGSAYYTRENCIVFPASELRANNADRLYKTILHEIFHIYSRYNQEKQQALYALIGYTPVEKVELSPFISQRLLSNPDGVNINYAINLTEKKTGRKLKAIPIIYSKMKKYSTDYPNFFSYLQFQLFEIEEHNESWKMTQENIGYDPDELSGFWEQIKKNTQYIIHPDEVLADNFILAIRAHDEGTEVVNDLNESGKLLVKEVQKIIASQ